MTLEPKEKLSDSYLQRMKPSTGKRWRAYAKKSKNSLRLVIETATDLFIEENPIKGQNERSYESSRSR